MRRPIGRLNAHRASTGASMRHAVASTLERNAEGLQVRGDDAPAVEVRFVGTKGCGAVGFRHPDVVEIAGRKRGETAPLRGGGGASGQCVKDLFTNPERARGDHLPIDVARTGRQTLSFVLPSQSNLRFRRLLRPRYMAN